MNPVNPRGIGSQFFHTAGGIVVFQASTFLAAIVVARQLGPSDQGRFQLLVALSAVLANLLNLGLEEGLAYQIPRYQINEPPKIRPLVRYAVAVTALVSILFGLLLFGFADSIAVRLFGDSSLDAEIRLALYLLPAMMLMNLGAGVLRGLGRSDLRSLVYYYGVGPGFLVALLVMAAFDLTLLQVEITRATSYMLAAFVAVVLVYRIAPPGQRHSVTRSDISQMHLLGGSLVLVQFSQYVVQQPTVDILIVGSIATSAAAGTYFVAAKIGSLIAVSMIAMTVVLGPALSESMARGDHAELLKRYAWASRWMILMGGFVGCATIALRKELLGIFGSQYVSAELVLVVFALAQIVVAVAGPNTPMLLATGRVRAEVYLTAGASLGMVVGGVVAGALFGAIGVAVASGASLAALGVIRYAICKRRYEFPPRVDYLYLLLPSVAAGICGAIALSVFQGGNLMRLGVGGTVYVVVFCLSGWRSVRSLRVNA